MKTKLRGLWPFFALLLVIAAGVLAVGASRGQALAAVPVLEDRESAYTPLLLAERDDVLVLVCSASARTGKPSLLLALDAESGRQLRRAELPSSVSFAALRGGSLFLRTGSALAAYSPEEFTERSRLSLPFDPDDLLFFDCDARGNAAYVLSGGRSTLCLLSADGERRSLSLSERITFLSCGAEGDVFAASRSTLFYLPAGAAEPREFSCFSPVAAALGNGFFLQRDATVCRVRNGVFSSLFQARELTDGLRFCLDSQNRLILAESSGAVFRFAGDGTLLDSCLLDGAALALCPAGAVIRKDGALCYSAFSFSEADAPPSPSPSPSPDPAAPESSEQPVRVEGGYLVAEPGVTVDQLRELMRPEAVELRDALGQPVLRGRLATGMTANDWIVVVEGDCDGSGSLTAADLKTAASLTLRGEDAGACFRAADLNSDGTIDTVDLLLLRAKLQGGS